MCLLAFAIDPTPDVRLVVAANRDEFYERPTSAAAFWADHSQILGGRDLQGGGTWLGVTRAGRFAALTNLRDPRAGNAGPTRGELPAGFLASERSAGDWADDIGPRRTLYRGFNLVVFDGSEGRYVSELADAPAPVASGVHALSNARLDVPWPKVRRIGRGVRHALATGRAVDTEELFQLLTDEQVAPDEELPDTGVGLELERALSPTFIRGATYGTRCSTVVVWMRGGGGTFEERSFGPRGVEIGRVRFTL